jgi:hypothetical protein
MTNDMYDEVYMTSEAVKQMMFHGVAMYCINVAGQPVEDKFVIRWCQVEGFVSNDPTKPYTPERMEKEMVSNSLWREAYVSKDGTLESLITDMVEWGAKVRLFDWAPEAYICFDKGTFRDERGTPLRIGFFGKTYVYLHDWSLHPVENPQLAKEEGGTVDQVIKTDTCTITFLKDGRIVLKPTEKEDGCVRA